MDSILPNIKFTYLHLNYTLFRFILTKKTMHPNLELYVGIINLICHLRKLNLPIYHLTKFYLSFLQKPKPKPKQNTTVLPGVFKDLLVVKEIFASCRQI